MGRILITGSTGLLGKTLVDYALKHTEHELVLVDTVHPDDAQLADHHRVVRYIQGDLTDYEVWKDACDGVDSIIQLAAITAKGVDPVKMHNVNVTLSWNCLCAAAAAGIKRVVLGSSINAIGGLFNKSLPAWQYFPLDESHPSLAEEAYSCSKIVLETQADCTARLHPDMRISSLRFHFIHPDRPTIPLADEDTRRDMWGWTSNDAASRACFLALEKAPVGHQAYFIVAPFTCCDAIGQGRTSIQLAEEFYPKTKIIAPMGDSDGFYSCEKAKRVLGWTHEDGGAEPSRSW